MCFNIFKNKDNNIAFLLGAGVSIPAKMPSTRELTKEILCDYENWCFSHNPGKNFQTVESYKEQHNGSKPNQNDINELGDFLQKVHSLLVKYYKNVVDITYEDLYDVMNQIHNNFSANYRNPIIEPFIQDLQNIYTNGIDSQSVQSMKFIEDVVKFRLLTNGRKAVLSPLINIVNDSSFKKYHIFTLNFDTLIEELLNDEKISFEDGFSKPLYDNQVSLWQFDSLLNSSKKVLLYKLHGSLNWEHLWMGEYHYQFVKLNMVDNYPYLDSDKVVRLMNRNTELLGISNKLFSYNYGIYNDLSMLFTLQLKQCNLLIISGYSFGDYGINLKIIDWMSRNSDAKIIFIDPDSVNTLKKANGSIIDRIYDWFSKSRFKQINEKFEDWDEDISTDP